MRIKACAIILCSAIATATAQSREELVHRFDYDRSLPLDLRESGVEHRDVADVHDISYASPKGGRVPAYLVVPQGKGPFAAAIWGHWYWGNSPQRNRTEFLDEAVALAKSGLVSLLFDGPVARPGHVIARDPLDEAQIRDRIQTILDVRRGADLLASRSDVDSARMAYVGHSYNASTGGYLSGIDKRFRAFVLMAGSLSDKVDLESREYREARQRIGPEKWDAFMKKWEWLDPGLFTPLASPAAVFLQYAAQEDFLTVERAKRYAAFVSEPKKFKAYETNHALNAEARRDRVEFLHDQLRLGPIDWDAVAKVPQLIRPTVPAR
jgi:dienelactone hydrolase